MYCFSSALRLADLDGLEPVQQSMGSTEDAGQLLSGRSLAGQDWNKGDSFREAKGRYIGLRTGKVIDMVHFMAAAASSKKVGGEMTRVLGPGLELLQSIAGACGNDVQGHSALSSEDLFSNGLGIAFSRTYDPDKALDVQVKAFLEKAGAISKEEFEKLFKDMFAAMPATEKVALQRYKEKMEQIRRMNDEHWEAYDASKQ